MIGLGLLFVAASVFAAPSAHGGESKATFEGCGTTKACFMYPAGCMSDETCDAAVSIEVVAGVYTFEMQSNGGVYIAVGLSADAWMGEDSVAECVYDELSSTTDFFMSYNRGTTNARVPTVGAALIEGHYHSDTKTTHCIFTRENSTVYGGVTFDLVNTPYHLLLAAGTAASPDGLIKHDLVNQPSANARRVGSPGIYQNVL